MALLTDRASLKRALFRLLNTDETDDALTEHDASALEGLYQLLQEGLEAAQLFLVDAGLGDYWFTTTVAALTWTGSDPNRYYTLPDGTGSDPAFLRLYGDQYGSALHYSDGTRWGHEARHQEARRINGDFFYVRGDRLYLAKNASPPADLYMDYIHRLPTLADSTTVDFPEADRGLIVAYAAVHAMEESWFAGTAEAEQKLIRNLERRKQEAYRRTRRSLQPRMLEPSEMMGEHWIY